MGKPFVGVMIVKDLVGVKRIWITCISDGMEVVSSTKLLSNKKLFQVNVNLLGLEVSMLYNKVPMICTKQTVEQLSDGTLDVWFLAQPGLAVEDPQKFTEKYIDIAASGSPEYVLKVKKAAILVRDEVAPYYSGRSSVNITLPSAFFCKETSKQLSQAMKVMKATNSVSDKSTTKLQTVFDAELSFALPSVSDIDSVYKQGGAEVNDIIPVFKDVFKPFKSTLASTPFWRMMRGMPERVRIASLRNLSTTGGMYTGMVREGDLLDQNYVDIEESAVMGLGSVDPVRIYPNEQAQADELKKLIMEDLCLYYPDYTPKEIEQMYTEGSLTPRMKEFIETMIIHALHHNWGQNGLLDYSVEVARYGEISISSSSSEDDEDDSLGDSLDAIYYPGNGGRDAGGNTLVRDRKGNIKTGELTMYDSPTDCDAAVLRYMSDTCRVNKQSGYVCAGCDGYIELLLKLLRWGDRRRYRITVGDNPVFDLSTGRVNISYKSISEREAELIGGCTYGFDSLITLDSAPFTVIGVSLTQRLAGMSNAIIRCLSITDLVKFYRSNPPEVVNSYIKGVYIEDGQFSVEGIVSTKRRALSSVLNIAAKQEGQLLLYSTSASALANTLQIDIKSDLESINSIAVLRTVDDKIIKFDFSSAEALYDSCRVDTASVDTLVSCAICRNFNKIRNDLHALSSVELVTDKSVLSSLIKTSEALVKAGITDLYDVQHLVETTVADTVVASTPEIVVKSMDMFSSAPSSKQEEESIEMKVMSSAIYKGNLPVNIPYVAVRNNYFRQASGEPFLICGYLCPIDKNTLLFLSKDELPEGAIIDKNQKDRPFATLVAESLIPLSLAALHEDSSFKTQYIFASTDSLAKAYKVGR